MSTATHYALRIGPFGPHEVAVHAVEGREKISSLFHFDVTVSTRVPPDVFERAVIARRGVLAIRAAGRRRAIHGVVTSLRSIGERPVGTDVLHQMVVRLAPRLALLQRKKGSRIFRHQRVDEVIGSVLAGAGIEAVFRLDGPSERTRYPACDYLTQYEETDYAFVRRLAAENGILFYFEQPSALVDVALEGALDAAHELGPIGDVAALIAGFAERELGPSERVVFTDRARYAPIPGAPELLDAALAFTPIESPAASMPFRAAGALGDTEVEVVSRFEPERRVRSTAATFRDHDFMRPRTPIQSSLSITPPSAEEGRELHVEPADLEVYEHGGRHLFPDWEDSAGEAAQMLRALRRKAKIARGTSSAARMQVGHRFHLEGHPDASGEYVVVEVRHRGGEGFGFTGGGAERAVHVAEITCVPATVVYVPALPKRRLVQVALTATVVGPAGQDIHVDARGEIKVRFHWDRRVGSGDDASAWIRTMHAWSGPGWGSQFIPRVGTEVVVIFEAGDPDRPLVLGSVYNGLTPTPFALPRDKTRSGFKTRSTPDGEDGNELSFEDARDREQIFVRAKRDLDTVVERNRSTTVRAEDTTRVAGDRSEEVAGKHVTVARSSRSVDVHEDDQLHVLGTRDVAVDTDLRERVGRERSVRVEGNDLREVFGESILVAESDVTARVRGSTTMLVGRNDAPRSLVAHVEGVTTITGTRTIDIASDKEVTLRSGSSAIRIRPGEIEILADKVVVSGKDARILLDEGSAKTKVTTSFQVVSEDTIALKSSGASVGLGSEAKIDGAQVLLNSPTNATDDIQTDDVSPTTIELVDQDGNPLAYERFRILFDDGSEMTGIVGADGKAKVLATRGGHIVFPDLSDAEVG